VLTQAQFRALTKPLERQVSQFHAAGSENWKWNAIRSFFVLLQKARFLLELRLQSRHSAVPDLYQ
jgi:hypothetical protein